METLKEKIYAEIVALLEALQAMDAVSEGRLNETDAERASREKAESDEAIKRIFGN